MNEKMLYNTKWYDYRPYMPDVANLLFITEWVSAYDKLLVRMGFDHFEDGRGSVIKKPFPYPRGDIVFLKAVNHGKDWKRFTRLRQTADSLCFPYWTFWAVGLQTMVDFDGFGFGLQAFDDTMLLGSTVDHVKTSIKEGPIQFAKMPFLQPDKYEGTRIQNDYCHYVVARIGARYGERAPRVLNALKGERLPELYFEDAIAAPC